MGAGRAQIKTHGTRGTAQSKMCALLGDGQALVAYFNCACQHRDEVRGRGGVGSGGGSGSVAAQQQ